MVRADHLAKGNGNSKEASANPLIHFAVCTNVKFSFTQPLPLTRKSVCLRKFEVHTHVIGLFQVQFVSRPFL